MNIPFLGKDLIFPSPYDANEQGILAVGGDLSVDRLLLAYRQGIFPWYEEGSPILWWSLPERFILEPSQLHLGKTVERLLRKNHFEIRYDTAFSEVIHACAQIKRKDQDGTWITPDMKQAYIHLHQAGYAHSIETYENNQLVGGVYGVSLGGAFFGESMFSFVSNASKIAFIFLCRLLKSWNFSMIDCQVYSSHMEQLGGFFVTQDDFLYRLQRALQLPTKMAPWCSTSLGKIE